MPLLSCSRPRGAATAAYLATACSSLVGYTTSSPRSEKRHISPDPCGAAEARAWALASQHSTPIWPARRRTSPRLPKPLSHLTLVTHLPLWDSIPCLGGSRSRLHGSGRGRRRVRQPTVADRGLERASSASEVSGYRLPQGHVMCSVPVGFRGCSLAAGAGMAVYASEFAAARAQKDRESTADPQSNLGIHLGIVDC